MKIKCPYCGSIIDDQLTNCPNCGAVNEGVVRSVKDQPQTIEELKQWYEARKLPPYETTRFFIGIDYKQPRAFGIYKDGKNGRFVVYKNKNDGSRAIRYEGTDEAYAVNELYQRLKQEIIEQKSRNGAKGNTANKKKLTKKIILIAIAFYIVLFMLPIILALKIGGPCFRTGYYNYNNSNYYHINDSYDDYNGHWYQYIDDDWIMIDYDSLPSELQSADTSDDFFTTRTWDSSTQVSDFDTSDAGIAYAAEADRWTIDNDDSNYDRDSDYDWDSGSDWDSGGTDWDSDW